MKKSLLKKVPLPLKLLLWTGALAMGWLAILALRNTVFFWRTDLDAGGSSALRMAAKEIVSTLVKPYYDRRLAATTDLPVYDLSLAPRRLSQWHRILEGVTERGRAQAEDQVYIPAVFRYGKESWEVDIRGRGTLAGHYRKEKPSLRVKFPADRHFRGDRVVNFIIPYEQTRVVVDTTLNAIAQHYDLLNYPRRFAVLRMNGETLGVYQEMPHFREEMGVLQGRAEGFFVSALGEGKGGADDVQHAGFKAAREQLMRCTHGCAPSDARRLLDVFMDAERMATYSALTTWFSSDHAWGPDNLILFFDPGRGRFEPIPWDIGMQPIYFLPGADEAPETIFESVVDLGESLVKLADFRHRRNQILWDLVQRKEAFALAEGDRQYEHLRPALDYDTEYSRRRTERFWASFRRIVVGNSKLLRGVLSHNALELKVTPDGLRWRNHGVAQVRVDTLVWTDERGAEHQVALDFVVPGRFRETEGEILSPLPLGFQGSSQISVEAYNQLTDEVLTPPEFRWDVAFEETLLPADEAVGGASPTISLPSPIPPGVQVVEGEAGQTWVFAGDIRLRQSWVLPEGVTVRFEPGLHLRLDPEVNLVIRGDLHSIGHEQRPISVTASSPETPFGTFAVVGRRELPVMVRWHHSSIAGGSEGDLEGLHLSGMFSIYDGSLDMRHSRLSRAMGEDGLNVKNGRAIIEDSLFEETYSDAIDLDFCIARLERNEVRGTGGDGFDFSGSIIEARDNDFHDLGDKGLSLGENSTVVVRNNRIQGATTGVAVKDLSLAELASNDFGDLAVGTAVYRKKAVFGSGTAAYLPGQVNQVEAEFLLDPGAALYRQTSSLSSLDFKD